MTFAIFSTADIERLVREIGPNLAPKKMEKKPKDETRSGRAYRLAVKTIAHGNGKRAFQQDLYGDLDLAEWAEESHPRNEDRAWERAYAKFSWMAEWKRHKNGAPISNLDNALQALRCAEDMARHFAYDEMLQVEMLTQPLPGSNEPWIGPRPVRDTDGTKIQEWLQENWLVSVSKDTTFQAVALCARERSYHPVRDYLNRLDWDGADRLDTWLSVYLGAAQSEYTAAIGKMFLISMVARIYRPGCKVDYVMILEGAQQGTQKSTILAGLPGEWFSDAMPDIRNSREASQHLDGKWLIEMSELSAIRKADVEPLKAFITRTHERYLKRYARKEVIEPRQCVFVGTTNEPKYLRDTTGNRRFWPVVTGKIDLEALRQDRDQLFAEAVARFQRGERWWPDRGFEKIHIEPEQDARRQEDPWENSIREYLHFCSKTTVEAVAFGALSLPKSSLNPATTARITAIMRAAGFVPKHTRQGNLWIDEL
jgi:predicted P-loop ATPase